MLPALKKDAFKTGNGRWRDLRRARLLEAAARVFAKVGYDEASIEEIAFEAGIGKPTLYRYFPSKAALFEAVFVDALNDLDARLEAVARMSGPFPQKLQSMIAEMVPTFRTHLASLRNLNEIDAAESKRRAFQEHRARIEARIVKAIKAAQLKNEARPLDAALIARVLIGVVRSATLSQTSDEGLTAMLSDLMLHGLATRPAS